MFVVGLVIHIIFLFSIFDIYFKSPIVQNVVPYIPQHEAVADRLVLFVVDGLRAESFTNYTTMPYMRSVANTYGRWGISNTRVPTESRPGHVAVIAGFYEDPSAIAKGWKENPVDFDSVFNQTQYTWCWGTYDIVDIFTKGKVDDHITVHKFDPYDQSFSTDKNTTQLDSWVFENVRKFFASAKEDKILNERLQKKKIAFFLHLLGTDTSGHTHKPKTKEFLTTVRFVDEGIKQVEKIIRDFYNNDGKTTFLMTSDHGMTDWGSHGAGDDHETQTPYVLWGAGVSQTNEFQKDSTTVGLSLDHRIDIKQADLAPLMSTILSIPVPVNSVGQLPVELLNMSLADQAMAIYSNSRQLASQYERKRLDVEAYAIPMLYQPYIPLTGRKYKEILEFTELLLQDGDFEKLILMSEEITTLSLAGLTYYHNYYQRPLLLLVTLSFIGWTVCLLKMLLVQKLNTQMDSSNIKQSNKFLSKVLNVIFSVLGVISFYLVYGQNLPVQYYLYFIMPILLWWQALSYPDTWMVLFKQLRRKRKMYSLWFEIFCYTIGSLALGLSFTYRWMLSVPLLGMGLWPVISSARQHVPNFVISAWMASCLILSIFSFMPVIGKDVFIELVVLAGCGHLVSMVYFISKIVLPLFHNNKEPKRQIIVTVAQMVSLILSLENLYTQSKRFEEGTPVSITYQYMAWLLAVMSVVSPLLASQRVLCRLSAINTAILNIYLLLSVSHEGLFMLTLINNLLCWIYIEFRLVHYGNTKLMDCSFENEEFGAIIKKPSMISVERSLSNQDFRRSFFFLLYIILAFFGTGNIASLNSFEVRWVTCFITSFQPFIITGLVLLKTLSPFLSVACSFRAVQHLTKAPAGYLHVIVLIYSNIMGTQLLFNVRNTGSWLEIGTSISQFVIVQVITLFIVVINQIAKTLTNANIYGIASTKKHV